MLRGRDDVRLAYVFGSTAQDQARPDSDLDVAVLFHGDPAPTDLDRLAFELAQAAGRPVDLIVLGRASPLLSHEVVSRGRLVVCRSDEERADFEARTMVRYLDTAHLRRIQHAYLRERAEAHRARSG